MKKVIIIPARLDSSRLPRKTLLDIDGKSMIRRVYEQCLAVDVVDGVYIATDSSEIEEHCREFTDSVVMTSSMHESGTDRVAEAARDIECDYIINVQGDEPFIEPSLIGSVASVLSSECQMSSAMRRITTTEELKDPNVVKVVTDAKGKALYFSRSIIPHHRDDWHSLINHHDRVPKGLLFYQHIGVYGYSKEFLLEYAQMECSYLERVERLEQLRVLEAGLSIQMVETEHESIGVDTLEDYHRAIEIAKGVDSE